MVFSSYTFLILFLPAVFVLYYGLPLFVPRKYAGAVHYWRSGVLLVASYVFYGWARAWYLLLILASTTIDLVCGQLLAKSTSRRRKKGLLLLSLVTNLGLLGYFKYRDFALGSVLAALHSVGWSVADPHWLHLVLPVGISFYTFQSMSYTIDVYNGVVTPLPWKRSIHFFSYVALFPQLVAGPIVRFRDIAAELVSRRHTWVLFGQGASLFMLGLSKKVLIANKVGGMADSLFAAHQPGVVDSWFGMSAYSLQIYFDFSGYSDMAIGLGMMFGFHFPWNFDAPYKSQSITEFWRRWHISLSTWLRDYLYIPLGGNRGGRLRTYRNLLLTMLLGGLWHGADWTFLLWGGAHGALLAFERALGKRPLYQHWGKGMRIALTNVLVLLAWVLFRAQDLPHAMTVFAGLFGLNGWRGFHLLEPYAAQLPLTLLAVGLLIAWFAPTSQETLRRGGWGRVLLTMILFCVAVLELLQSSFNPFLYYQF